MFDDRHSGSDVVKGRQLGQPGMLAQPGVFEASIWSLSVMLLAGAM